MIGCQRAMSCRGAMQRLEMGIVVSYSYVTAKDCFVLLLDRIRCVDILNLTRSSDAASGYQHCSHGRPAWRRLICLADIAQTVNLWCSVVN